MEFQYSHLIFLAFIPFIIFYLFKYGGKEKNNIPTLKNPNIKRLNKVFGSKAINASASGKFNWPLFLVWLSLVLALMHPQKIEKISKTKTFGYDIMITLDLSRSMMALDFSSDTELVTRLDIVKSVAKKFIIERMGDRIGLVLFGDTAYLQSPLSGDVASVASMLEYVEVGIAGEATAIGDAIALSVKSLIEKPEGSRVMVLLTDGSNTAGSILPEEAINLAKKYGVKIYSIGVGRGGKVPFKMPDGSLARFSTDIDENLLKKVAKETGGEYFRAENKETLANIYQKIDELEKTEAETNEIIIRKQLYHYPLTFGLVIFVFIFLSKFRLRKVLEF